MPFIYKWEPWRSQKASGHAPWDHVKTKPSWQETSTNCWDTPYMAEQASCPKSNLLLCPALHLNAQKAASARRASPTQATSHRRPPAPLPPHAVPFAHLWDMGLRLLALTVHLRFICQQPLDLVLQDVAVYETFQLLDLLRAAAPRLRGGWCHRRVLHPFRRDANNGGGLRKQNKNRQEMISQ